MIKRKDKLIIAALVLLIFAYCVFDIASIYTYGKKDEAQKADVIIVLGAATYEGELSAVYRERLNHGILLYRSGYSDKIIVTGAVAKGNTISDAQAAKSYVIENGIPEKDVILEESSTVTLENMEYSKAIMDEYKMKTAIIVSDPLHMKRSMLLAKKQEIAAFSSPTKTSRYQTVKTKLPFLLREFVLYEGYKVYFIFK